MTKGVKELLFRLDIVPQSRDRHPRLSAKTLPIKAPPSLLQRRGCCLTGCYLGIYKRTDEGVCPYFVIPIWLKRTIQIGFREALLPLGEAGRGFHPRASVPTLWHCFDTKKTMAGNKERLSLMWRDALFASRKRPLHIEESLSFFTVSCSLLTKHCLVTNEQNKKLHGETRYIRFNVYICCRQNNTY